MLLNTIRPQAITKVCGLIIYIYLGEINNVIQGENEFILRGVSDLLPGTDIYFQ